jgi:hypothetical protein
MNYFDQIAIKNILYGFQLIIKSTNKSIKISELI